MQRAKIHSLVNEAQFTDTRRVIAQYGPLLKWRGKDTLMDIGCGSGEVTMDLVLAREYKTIFAMDLDQDLINKAREKYCTKYDRLFFEQGDILGKMKYRNAFDHVTSFFTLHRVHKQRSAFNNIYKVLRPGGDCLISILAQCPLFDAYRKMAKVAKWEKYMKDIEQFIPPYHKGEDPVDKAEGYLNNFQEGQVFLKKRKYVYKDADALKASLKQVSPFHDKLPKNEMDNFYNVLIQAATDMELIEVKEDGRITVRYTVLVIYARK